LIRIREVLFLGEGRFGCRVAAYFNDDSRIDIFDTIGNILFLFLGGPSPGPSVQPSGIDLEPHTRDGCSVYDSC
jgi:hypothetical protein